MSQFVDVVFYCHPRAAPPAHVFIRITAGGVPPFFQKWRFLFCCDTAVYGKNYNLPDYTFMQSHEACGPLGHSFKCDNDFSNK